MPSSCSHFANEETLSRIQFTSLLSLREREPLFANAKVIHLPSTTHLRTRCFWSHHSTNAIPLTRTRRGKSFCLLPLLCDRETSSAIVMYCKISLNQQCPTRGKLCETTPKHTRAPNTPSNHTNMS